MNRAVRTLSATLFVLFAVVIVDLTYLQAIAGPRYRDDLRNQRVQLERTGRERGAIMTTDGVVIAESRPDPDDLQAFRRTYPHRELYAHVVGHSTLLFGDSGLEHTRASTLRSGQGSTLSNLISALLGEDLRPKELRLTIDHRLQQVAFEALGDQSGAIVAIDPVTGAVLAMVSKPSFDPNPLVGIGAAAYGDALTADPDHPLLNRATAASYPPGSTFKVITTAAALESGRASPDTTY
ncbi:MAG: penicillin-binding transpeptidase domain-containing protein, partial [Acidimicrobiia bacterium]